MFNALMKLGLVALFALVIAGIASVYRYKRPEFSWRHILAAGPLIYFRPAEYVQPGRARVPKTLFLLSVLLFIALWVCSWVHDNV